MTPPARILGSLVASLCLATPALHAHAAETATSPGTPVGSTALPPALSLPDAGRALRLTYLSTDGVTGKGTVPVTAEVILPPGKPPVGGWPIVAWAHGTVGIGQACTPSLHPYSARNSKYLAAWMKRGFAVVATDYQGLGTTGVHPYLNTRVEAYNVLDSVRAAVAAVPELRNTVMIVGQSQGGGAAFAAAAFAATYAPDVNIRGTVATGVPYFTPALGAQLTAAAQVAAPVKYDPLVVYMLYLGASLAARDPAFHPEDAFTPRAMAAYNAASTTCVGDMEQKIRDEGLTLPNAMQPGFSKALAPAFAAMAYPTLKLAQPLFVGTGTDDRDVPPVLQLSLVKDACAAGSTVQAHLYKGLDHSQTVNASLPDSAAFTQAVMAGQPVAPQCAPVPQ
ncbi:alpha/beta fold hydrolase [Komagataeibacter nataicola]|uniref:lipase family protein n=1 Tax=Komagataeibacter nataicola TaxID=265960 RepID=UPI0023DD33FF|nr:lipase family protein [Komagataeibacter nataicola]WEQ56901.1 alpha/beta fold hydrolase [Komagataeibacter nataicola]